jgi:predicted nucleic acid-binding protein
MTTGAGEPVFLDTNILVYACWSVAPLHARALAAIQQREAAGVSLWISRQVLREYLATLARPRVGIPIATLTAEVRQFAARFQIVDANIVATMQVTGIRQILTNNPRDFAPFMSLITVVPLA